MIKASENIKEINVKTELRSCQECGYKDGFHVSFRSQDNSSSLQLILICPNCGARYDIGKEI